MALSHEFCRALYPRHEWQGFTALRISQNVSNLCLRALNLPAAYSLSTAQRAQSNIRIWQRSQSGLQLGQSLARPSTICHPAPEHEISRIVDEGRI